MPWLLNTPINAGDLDGQYGEIKITRFFHDSIRKVINVDIEYGNTVNGVWEKGYTPRSKEDTFVISGAEYDNLIANSIPKTYLSDPSDPSYVLDPNTNVWVELTYVAVKRSSYEWLVNNNHIDPGTLT